MKKMLRAPVYKSDRISIGDKIAIWRDASAWLAPARVTKIKPYYLEVIHSSHIKTSGINRILPIIEVSNDEVQRINTVISPNIIEEADDDPAPCAAQPTVQDEVEAELNEGTGNQSDNKSAAPRNPSQLIRHTELKRLLHDASPLVEEQMGTTRSRTDAIQVHPSDAPHCHGAGDSDNDGHSRATYLKPPTELSYQTFCKPLSDEDRRAAFDAELAEWVRRGAYTVVYESSILRGESNIIGSHVV